jgi:Tol biopolymer transport system component/DNA-binding winged helix-turn-helix (wHTH) protein
LAQSYRFDDVVVDPSGFRVIRAGKPVDLEPKALSVLILLIENRGRLVDKRELIHAVWGDSFVTDNVLSRAIAQLRKGLADGAKEARYIETVPTRGYRFVAEVSVDDVGDGPLAGAQATRSSSTLVRQRSWRRVLIAFGTVVVLAFAALGVLVFRNSLFPAKPFQIANNVQITSSSGLSIFPTLSPDSTRMAYSTDRGGSFEIFVRQLAAGGQDVQITKDGGQNLQPAWSPDGTFLAYYSNSRGGIWLIPALGGPARKLSEFGSHPSWSRDGEWIVFQSGGDGEVGPDSTGAFPPSTIWMMKPDGSSAREITRPGLPEGGHGAPSLSPDGQHVAFVSTTYGSSAVWCAPTAGGLPVRLAERFIKHFDPVFSPDGASVLFGTAPSTLWRLRISTRTCAPNGEPESITSSGGGRLKHLAISRDGKKLAYSSENETSNLLSLPLPRAGVSTGDAVALTSKADCRSSVPAFSPDGTRIAFASCHAGTVGPISVMNADGSDVQQLTAEGERAIIPSWFPDGRHILYLVQRPVTKLESVDIETRQQGLVTELRQDAGRPQLSPNGARVAFNSSVNGVQNLWLMDMATKQLTQLTFDKKGIGFPVWSPDGKMLAAGRQRGDDDNLVLVNPATGAVQDVLSDHAKNWCNSWSADGRSLYCAKLDEHRIWNIWTVTLSTGMQKQLTSYSALNSYVRYPVVSPRGTQVVYEYTVTTGNIWMLEFK